MEKNNELFQKLKNRFREDQKLSKNKEFEKLEKVYKENSEWLKEVIEKNGWPREEKVNDYGELCAWLIAQHSPDINFQKNCLKILKSLPKTEERKQHIAYLGDRILIKESKKQIYGTQFNEGKPWPIKDVKNLEKRRKEIGLEPFKEYRKRMSID